MKQFKTIAEVKQANKQAGLHFFDKKTMEFFNSRIESTLINKKDNNRQYFITSEQFTGLGEYIGKRLFTIREVKENGEIKTIGEFQGYNTKQEAKKELKK